MKFFVTPLISMFFGLGIAAAFSWMIKPDAGVLVANLLTVILLSILEISLSFDNAVVNATVLQKMDDIWKKRFLTWGMAIAVFGMRLLFPLGIVSIVAGVSVWDSLVMAVTKPDDYAHMMTSAHLAVTSFGGAFLLMVFLDFLFTEKDLNWIKVIEKPAGRLSSFQSIELIIAICVMMGVYSNLPQPEKIPFLVAYIWGILTYLIVHGFSLLLEDERVTSLPILSSGLGMFLYLEVLDASFSFDGVVGAFAISNQLIIIMIGLGIGAFFVRGITLYLVEHKTLEQFMFLEHGAFYALGILSFFMLLDSFFHFSEAVTALSGGAILLASIFWSIKENRKRAARKNNDGT